MTTEYYRYRLDFRKSGDLRWIGHHDLARTVERLLRRLDLPLRMSQGFHPKPKIRFASALALGIESRAEWVEFELDRAYDEAELLRRIQLASPAGLEFTGLQQVSGSFPQLSAATYEASIPPSYRAGLRESVARLCAADEWFITHSGKNQRIDLRAGLISLSYENGRLRFTVAAGRQGAVRPREVLAALGLQDIESHGGKLCRVELQFDPHGSPKQPITSAERAPSTSGSRRVKSKVQPQVLKPLDEEPS